MNKRQIGSEYEERACEYLRSLGMTILERNYRKKIGEIDIIALDSDSFAFIEVKYRSYKDQGGAAYTIPVSKQRTIARMAQWYMAENHIPADTFCRFDAVLFDGDDLEYIKNAWRL